MNRAEKTAIVAMSGRYFSLIASSRRIPSTLRPREIVRLQQQDDNDDERLDHQIILRRQAAGENRSGQRLNDQRAENRHAKIDAPARERAAADDDRENGVELDVEADADGIRRMGVGGQHHTRPGGAKSADDIGGVLDQAGIDSGQIRRRRIAADRFEKQSESSAADQQPQARRRSHAPRMSRVGIKPIWPTLRPCNSGLVKLGLVPP